MRSKIGSALLWTLRSCWALPLAIAVGWVLYAVVAWWGSYVSLNEGVEPPLWLVIVMGNCLVLTVSTLLLGPLWLIVMTVLWIRQRQWVLLVWGVGVFCLCRWCGGGCVGFHDGADHFRPR